MARRLAAAGVIRDVQDLTRRLVERERLGCTSLGGGVAIPHCKSRDVEDVALSIGLAPGGIDFHSADGVPVTLIFLILSPADQPAVHLQALARISRLLRTPGVVETLRRASTGEEILEALKEAQASSTAAGA
jgi:mannitol/fructose-specific phosphotransferase system IIA component (Ntr-type)